MTSTIFSLAREVKKKQGIHIPLRRFSDMCIPLRAPQYSISACCLIPSEKQSPTFSLRLLDKVKNEVFRNLTENKTIICSLLSRHFYYCNAHGAGCSLYPHAIPHAGYTKGYVYGAGDTRIPRLGIHISRGRGYTYTEDTLECKKGHQQRRFITFSSGRNEQ